MDKTSLTRKQISHHLDKRLRFRVRMYLVISVIMLLIVGYDVVMGNVLWWIALVALLAGGVVGVVAARMQKVSWDKNMNKIVSRLDKVGVFILVIYILFALMRRQILGDFIEASQLAGATFALIAGVMIGRVWGTGRQIMRVVAELTA